MISIDNDEMLLVIKDMFEKTVRDIKKEVKNEIEEVKSHVGVLVEKLEGDIQVIAEGHDTINRKIDALDQKVEDKTNELKKEIKIVAGYVIGVDAKLNEHEVILKRVK